MFVYLQNWHSGRVIKCRVIDESGDFEISPRMGLASENLGYINTFWRLLPDRAPVGMIPDDEQHEFTEFFIRAYRNRKQYASVEELLTAARSVQFLVAECGV